MTLTETLVTTVCKHNLPNWFEDILLSAILSFE